MTNCVKYKHVVSLSADIPLKGEKVCNGARTVCDRNVPFSAECMISDATKGKKSYQHDFCRGQRRGEFCADTLVMREIREEDELSCIHSKYVCAIERQHIGSDVETRTASIIWWIVGIQICGGLAREYFVESEMCKEGEYMRCSFRVCALHCQRNPNWCVAMKGESNTTNCVDNKVVTVVCLRVGIHVKVKSVWWSENCMWQSIKSILCHMSAQRCMESKELFQWKRFIVVNL